MLPVVRDRVVTYNEQFEGKTHHMYLDTKGNVTVAVGNLLADPGKASALGFTHGLGGPAATSGEKSAAWTTVHNATPGLRVDTSTPGNPGGNDTYGKLTDLRLDDAGIDALVMKTANGFDSANAAEFPDYANFPADAQLGLMGMRWPGSWNTFPTFRDHVRNGRWFGAARECFFDESNNPKLKLRNLHNRWLFCLAGRTVGMEIPEDVLYYDKPGANKVYLFKAGQYVRYDWDNDKVDPDFPAGLAEWDLTEDFATGVDTAFVGWGAYAKPAYLGRTYFFHGPKYVRYDWDSKTIDVGPTDITGWGLKGKFAESVDASVNGQGQYFGKLYFFKGDKYVRYNWATDKPDLAETSISDSWGLPGTFKSGIDAVVSGEGKFSGKLYFFQGDKYVRCNWDPYQVETPDPVSISPAWGGLKKLDFGSGITAAVNGPGCVPSAQAQATSRSRR